MDIRRYQSVIDFPGRRSTRRTTAGSCVGQSRCGTIQEFLEGPVRAAKYWDASLGQQGLGRTVVVPAKAGSGGRIRRRRGGTVKLMTVVP